MGHLKLSKWSIGLGQCFNLNQEYDFTLIKNVLKITQVKYKTKLINCCQIYNIKIINFLCFGV